MTKLHSTVRQKSFGKIFFINLTFLVNCGFWFGICEIRRNIIVRGVGSVLCVSRGTISWKKNFSRKNFRFSILLRHLDFPIFAAENHLFFFGEVFLKRLLKVYSWCSEEKSIFFCEELSIFTIFRLWNPWNIFFFGTFCFSKSFKKSVNTDLYVSRWTFKLKRFFSLTKLRVFKLFSEICNIGKLMTISQQGSQNRILPAQRNVFRQTIFLSKLKVFSELDKINCNCKKNFSTGFQNSNRLVQEKQFLGKHFFRKNKFHQFCTLERNLFENVCQLFDKVVILEILCRVERFVRELFFLNKFSFLKFPEFIAKWFRKFGKCSMAGLPKLKLTCPDELFESKKNFLWENYFCISILVLQG